VIGVETAGLLMLLCLGCGFFAGAAWNEEQFHSDDGEPK